MHSRLLRYFLAIVEHKGFTSAAAKLNISQPALTKSIHQLEEVLGVALFDRLPTGVVPTRFGEILARRSRLMELEYRHAIVEIQALKGGSQGTVNVGAGPVWAARILPPIIAGFRSQRPKMKIRLTTGVIDTLVPALLGGELDVICTALDFPNHPEITREHLRHVLVARAEHPLARRANIRPSELLNYPWVALVNDHAGARRVNSFFAANELDPPRISVETSSTNTVLSILQADNFIVNIPTLMLLYAAKFGIRRLSVRGTLWDAPAGIAYRTTKTPAPAVNAFCALVRSEFVDPKGLREQLSTAAI